MQNSDKVSTSISLAGPGQLVKMFITRQTHDIFQSNCAYLYIYHGLATDMQNGYQALTKNSNAAPAFPTIKSGTKYI